MRMLMSALVGGALIGFVYEFLLSGLVDGVVSGPSAQAILAGAVAAFLGALWGWLAKGIFGSRISD